MPLFELEETPSALSKNPEAPSGQEREGKASEIGTASRTCDNQVRGFLHFRKLEQRFFPDDAL